jgi:hypothetical protein
LLLITSTKVLKKKRKHDKEKITVKDERTGQRERERKEREGERKREASLVSLFSSVTLSSSPSFSYKISPSHKGEAAKLDLNAAAPAHHNARRKKVIVWTHDRSLLDANK